MNNKFRLYIDQYGNKFGAKSVRELRRKIGNGGSRVSKMFIDRKGQTLHTGYVVGRHWLMMFCEADNRLAPNAPGEIAA